MAKKGTLYPIQDSTKNRLSRQVYLIFPPLKELSRDMYLEKSKLMSTDDYIGCGKIVKLLIEKISHQSELLIPSINLKIDSKHNSNDLKNLIISIPDKENLRAFIIFYDSLISNFRKEEIDSFLVDRNISHFVEIFAVEKNNFWVNSDDISNVKIFSNKKMREKIIIDIILDIALFHSFGYLEEKYVLDPKYKFSFSKLKYDFIKQKKLVNKYPTSDSHLGYISLATASRKDGKLDISKYVSLWYDFVAFLYSQDHEFNQNSKNNIVNKALKYKKSVLEQIENHKDAKQISQKKLLSLVKNANTGMYLLLRTQKNPNRKIDKIRILNIMGGKIWKLGKLKLIPFEKLNEVIKYYPYISIFKIEV